MNESGPCRPGERDDQASPEAFDSLLASEQGFLLALIRTIGVPPLDAPDVLQTANLYLVEKRDRFRPGTDFRAWATQVVRFRCLGYFRERKRRPMVNISEQALDLVAAELAGHFDEAEAQLARLQDCITKLPAEHRDLLGAAYHDDVSLKDYAARTHKTHSAVRKTLSRIRQTLKACIEAATLD